MLRSQFSVAPHRRFDSQHWFYLYRWGVSPIHLSSRSDTTGFYKDVGKMPIEAGRFVLNPHWRQDYTQLCQDYVAATAVDASS